MINDQGSPLLPFFNIFSLMWIILWKVSGVNSRSFLCDLEFRFVFFTTKSFFSTKALETSHPTILLKIRKKRFLFFPLQCEHNHFGRNLPKFHHWLLWHHISNQKIIKLIFINTFILIYLPSYQHLTNIVYFLVLLQKFWICAEHRCY